MTEDKYGKIRAEILSILTSVEEPSAEARDNLVVSMTLPELRWALSYTLGWIRGFRKGLDDVLKFDKTYTGRDN